MSHSELLIDAVINRQNCSGNGDAYKADHAGQVLNMKDRDYFIN